MRFSSGWTDQPGKTRIQILLTAVIGALAASSSAFGDWLYSIDSTCGALVRINDETGQVVVLNQLDDVLSVSAPATGIALLGDDLYVLGHEYEVETRLLRFNPLTGDLLSNVEVTVGGSSVLFAEGLAERDNELVIAFHAPDGGPFDSNALGTVGADGVITAFVSLGPSADMDDIALDRDTQLMYAYDRVPPVTSDLYAVGTDPPSHTYLGTLFGGEDLSADIEITDGVLIALVESAAIHRIDLNTQATLEILPLSRPGSYRSLAHSDRDWTCPPDLDSNGAVDTDDLLSLLAIWGPNACSNADLDGDGQVGVTDLLTLLAQWGDC